MYPVRSVAQEIINYEDGRCAFMNALKLNFLLYFVQIYHLITTGEKMFPEPIIKYDFGPVVESVYRTYEKFPLDSIPGERYGQGAYVTGKDREEIKKVANFLSDYMASDLLPIVQNTDCYMEAAENEEITTESLLRYYSGGKPHRLLHG